MLTLIHGGPADADGNHFEADWYQWDRLAASSGWLVFEPNYRGSTGYGDKFILGIIPEIVSRPGKDILAGVDALVKDGTADSQHLTIGGYSYGGYTTNWLITQTTRFKAAVTGAGAVEHVANWGNDDTVFDDAYFLGGRAWEAAKRYHDEAAIYQIDKVRTPTHVVGGAEDVRVAVLENYLLERALHSLRIPSALLIFPGEGHSLDKNPWHGKIKVREELKWLQKYGGVPVVQ
jgi:dipeptidyl aminopeptidase/acylaminoacyl peptidase